MDADSGWRAIDAGLLRWAYGLDLPTKLAQAVTHLVTHGGVVLLVALALLAFGRGRTRRAGIALVVGLVVHVVLLEGVIKHAVARERPFAALGLTLRDSLVDPTSYSFPSGHSAAGFLCAWIVGARYPRWQLPLLALACLIALSRLHLGAHYPTDVAAGAVFGMLLGGVLVRAARVADVDARAARCGEDLLDVDSVVGDEPEARARTLERWDGGLSVEDELPGEPTEQRCELEAVAREAAQHDDA